MHNNNNFKTAIVSAAGGAVVNQLRTTTTTRDWVYRWHGNHQTPQGLEGKGATLASEIQ